METSPKDVEDFVEGDKFVDVNGDICTVTSVGLDDDGPAPCCEYCGIEEYCWIYFDRPNGAHDQYRLWKWSKLNATVSL